MKFSDVIGKLHCGAGFNTGQKQKTLSVPGRLWSMYIRAVEWNLTTGLLTVEERTLSHILSGANKVVNALRLWTRAFIAGLTQIRWTPWSKPMTWF
jgi:hypothetical protein